MSDEVDVNAELVTHGVVVFPRDGGDNVYVRLDQIAAVTFNPNGPAGAVVVLVSGVQLAVPDWFPSAVAESWLFSLMENGTAGAEAPKAKGARKASAKTPSSAGNGVELLRHLLRLGLRDGNQDTSVARLLKDGDLHQIAKDNGFRLDGGLLKIGSRHSALVGRLRGSKWGGVDIQGALLQVDRVTKGKNPISFGTVKTRAVCVPREVCEELGINIFESRGA